LYRQTTRQVIDGGSRPVRFTRGCSFFLQVVIGSSERRWRAGSHSRLARPEPYSRRLSLSCEFRDRSWIGLCAAPYPWLDRNRPSMNQIPNCRKLAILPPLLRDGLSYLITGLPSPICSLKCGPIKKMGLCRQSGVASLTRLDAKSHAQAIFAHYSALGSAMGCSASLLEQSKTTRSLPANTPILIAI